MYFAIENEIEVMFISVCDGCIMLFCNGTLSAMLSEHEELTTEQESITSCYNKFLVDMEASKQYKLYTKDGG